MSLGPKSRSPETPSVGRNSNAGGSELSAEWSSGVGRRSGIEGGEILFRTKLRVWRSKLSHGRSTWGEGADETAMPEGGDFTFGRNSKAGQGRRVARSKVPSAGGPKAGRWKLLLGPNPESGGSKIPPRASLQCRRGEFRLGVLELSQAQPQWQRGGGGDANSAWHDLDAEGNGGGNGQIPWRGRSDMRRVSGHSSYAPWAHDGRASGREGGG
jgi:hypothetical protein